MLSMPAASGDTIVTKTENALMVCKNLLEKGGQVGME